MMISIVIPCRNEEDYISRCLNSVIKATEKFNDHEILVADGASIDRTIEEAVRFPVNIIQLKPDWIHTSSAGRYLGYINTSGKYVLFIDADMELAEGFLEKAIEFMEKNKDIGCVAGIEKEFHIEKSKTVACLENLYGRSMDRAVESLFLGGAGLFRRKALEEAGPFDPYLYSEEEMDVCQRLRKNKWKIFSVPYNMTIHYTEPDKSWENFRKQVLGNRFTGIGQVMRRSIKTGFFWEDLLRFKKFCFFLVFTAGLAMAAPILLLNKKLGLLIIEAISIVLVYIYLTIKNKSFKKAARSAVKWIVIVFTVMKGFLLPVKDIKDYPTNVLVIKRLSL